MSFDTMFPPELWPVNAGMLSMIEDDVTCRANKMLNELHRKYDYLQPFDADLITDALHRYGLEYHMLPAYLQDELDEFDVF